MKYQIKQKVNGIEIEVSGIEGKNRRYSKLSKSVARNAVLHNGRIHVIA